jgi:DNA-binding HxlR family transcriptional regulator
MRAADPPPSKPVKGKEFKKPKQAPAADASAGGDDGGGGKGAVCAGSRPSSPFCAPTSTPCSAPPRRLPPARPAGQPTPPPPPTPPPWTAQRSRRRCAGRCRASTPPTPPCASPSRTTRTAATAATKAGDAAPAVTSASRQQIGLAALLEAATDERVARVAYALASPPKVALIRSLLEHGPRSAARLAERTGLSTGSLYHHLRELVHAEVVWQSARNQYALTPLGYQASLLLFALAGAAGETAAAP